MRKSYEVTVGIETQRGEKLEDLLRWGLDTARQNKASAITVREVIEVTYDLIERQILPA